jgi:predicted RNase H-like nuclease (RuvC/YqgF family)
LKTTCLQNGKFKDYCVKCFFDVEEKDDWKCMQEGRMAARTIMSTRQENSRLNGAELFSSAESPPIAGENPIAGSSSQVSLANQTLKEEMAELQEKVKGISGLLDEVAVLKEQVQRMQEQIDVVPQLEEKVNLVQEQIDELVKMLKSMQEQIDRLSPPNWQQSWQGRWQKGWSEG